MELGFAEMRIHVLARKIIEEARYNEKVHEYERKPHSIITQDEMVLSGKIREWFRVVFQNIEPYLEESRMVDLGCGNGYVGKWVAGKGYDVTLVDAYENPVIKESGLFFIKLANGKKPDG